MGSRQVVRWLYDCGGCFKAFLKQCAEVHFHLYLERQVYKHWISHISLIFSQFYNLPSESLLNPDNY